MPVVEDKKRSAWTVGLQVSFTVCMHGPTYSKSMDQPGRVANPARGQLNRRN